MLFRFFGVFFHWEYCFGLFWPEFWIPLSFVAQTWTKTALISRFQLVSWASQRKDLGLDQQGDEYKLGSQPKWCQLIMIFQSSMNSLTVFIPLLDPWFFRLVNQPKLVIKQLSSAETPFFLTGSVACSQRIATLSKMKIKLFVQKSMLFLPDFYVLTLRVTHALNRHLVTSASSVHFSGLRCARYSKPFLNNFLSELQMYIYIYVYIYLTFKLRCFELNQLTGLLNANSFSTALLNWFIPSKTASVHGTNIFCLIRSNSY